MEEIRKFHNDLKRDLITKFCKDKTVLDVGCGFGGDLQKYRQARVFHLTMCDPSPEALVEARQRAQNLGIQCDFHEGDILAIPSKVYDVIVYNFSLQYIFASRDLFLRSIQAIASSLQRGGKLIGIVPDSMQVIMMTPFKDHLGNQIMRNPELSGKGEFGENAFMFLADTPFYANLMKPEPIAYKDLLVLHASKHRLHLELWEPVVADGISGLYSRFSFVKK